MSMAKDLLSDVERFLRKHKMEPMQFGRLALKNGYFVAQLRAGSNPRVDTYERVKRFMEGYQK
jgi:hypothetical protein